MPTAIFVRGSGSVAPPEHVTTEDLARRLINASPVRPAPEVCEQYVQRATRVAEVTGIRARRFFPADLPLDEILASLAHAVVPAGFDWSTLDGIIVASTSVGGFPGSSQRLVARLRGEQPALAHPFTFDLNSNACTNFIYGLGIASALLEARGHRNVLCLAVELASRCISRDIRDLDTSALFGDAAAGLLLSREPGFARLQPPRLTSRVDPAALELLVGGAGHPSRIDRPLQVDPAWRIPGPEVARRATALLAEELLAAKARGDEFEWLLPHQANDGKILAPGIARAGVARERVLMSLHELGNTSAASLPVTFDMAYRAGRLRPGERVLLLAFGASFTLGSAIVEILPSPTNEAAVIDDEATPTPPPARTSSPHDAVAIDDEAAPTPRPARTSSPPDAAVIDDEAMPARRPARTSTLIDDEVVFVGMAARFPEAADLDRYWANLRDGRDCTRDVPADRWDIGAWFDPNPRAPNRTYCRRGGFIPDAHAFDPRFFRIAPAEAQALDPQQRVFLEVAYEALERAGSVGPALSARRTGVYVGLSGQENPQRTVEVGADIGPSFVSGNTFSIVANRLSYHLDLHGPSIALDTACSSSLVALHLARQALLSGEIDTAVIGAASITLAPWKYISFAKAGMLAPDGRCKSFSAAADGYVPGEGVAAAVLRRRSDAVRDGDNILAVIKSSGINQDGRTNGITAPSPQAQQSLYEHVYRSAGIDPSTIDYIEAHGTGTSVGDPIEVGALRDAFATFTEKKQFCGIGSVKTNIGHLEPAAGMASIVKLLLALRHGVIPPTLHLDVPSPHIRFEDTPFFPVVRPLPWPARATPRRAATSAMSFGGVNAHVVLEEPPAPSPPPAPPRAYETIALSARTPRALLEVMARLRTTIATQPELRLEDLAFTLATGREQFERRAAIVASSTAELLACLAEPPPETARARDVVLVARGPADGAAAALADLLRREPLPPTHANDPLTQLRAALVHLWTSWLAEPPVVEDMSAPPDASGHVPSDIFINSDGQLRITIGVAASGEAALAEALAAAHRHGLAIDWLAVHAARRGTRIELPTYPLERQRLEQPRSVGRAGNTTPTVTPPPAATSSPLWLPRWTPQPPPAPTAPSPCWLLFEDTTGVAAELVASLRSAGSRAIRVRPGPAFDEPAPDEYIVHPASPGDHAGLFAALARQNLTPDIIHLGALGPRGDVLGDPDHLEIALSRGTFSLFCLLQTLAQPRRRPPRRLVIASSDALPAGGPLQVEKGGIAGLLRSAALELPELRIHMIDVAGDAPRSTIATQVLTDLHSPPTTPPAEPTAPPPSPISLSAWRDERRLALTWHPASPTPDAPSVLRERGVYWISGGLGALGRRLALHLALQVRARLVLTGRTTLPERSRWDTLVRQSPPDDPTARVLRDLLAIEAAGSEILMITCDAAEPWQVRDTLRQIEARFGALHGVIHAAGVLRDGLIKSKTLTQVRDVLRPKLTAARTLADALAGRPLDFLALFSSIAGTFGNLGQADYAAANGLLGSLAHALSAAGRRVVALDWSMWSGDGMGAGLEAMARARGLVPLDPPLALTAFTTALQLGHPHVLIAHFAAPDPTIAPPRDVPADMSPQTSSPVIRNVPEDMSPRAAPAPPALDLQRFAETWLTGVVSRALDLPPEDIGHDTKFLELGVDSILSVNILEELETKLAARLSPSLLFDFFSVGRLSRHLAGQYTTQLATLVTPDAPAPTPAPQPSPGPTSQPAVEAWLTGIVAAALDLPPEDIGHDMKFLELGVDSILSVNILEELETRLSTKLSPSLLFDFFTVPRLARHLVEQHPAALARHLVEQHPAALASLTDPEPTAPLPITPPIVEPLRIDPPPSSAPASIDPIAVIGMACRFPGADDPAAFWDNLTRGVDSIREPPPGRFDADRWYSPDKSARNRTYLKRGGWLAGLDLFDAAYFRISPREADWMAPAQRLFLEVAWQALEDAGHAGARASRATTGVFAGVIPNDSPAALVDSHDVELTPTGATGNALSIVANRVSYLFDLRGPSFAVDTACSSALVAIHLACQSLQGGECDLAIAGGVNVDIAPQRLVAFAKAGFFSPDGRCKPFDDRGDGYVFGEGVGAVVLKPLSKALADGDEIHAVIRGSAINQDGLTNGLTAPSSLAQERVLRSAYTRAGVDPASVGYIEAHGTGTSLGDPIELRALGSVFTGRGSVALGSVKSNVGHLEGAAGISAIIKTCMMLRQRTLVPSLHFEIPNHHLELARSPFWVVDRSRPWPAPADTPRRAGVSSFGFGGTNVHVVLEEPPPRPAPERHQTGELLVLSAHSETSLASLADTIAATCRSTDPPQLADLCFTAATGRAERAHRLAVVAATPAELARKLSEGTGVFRGQVDARQRPRIAMLCPGQGAQQPRMAERLYRDEPHFRRALDRCADLLRPHLDVPLLTLLYPAGGAAPSLARTEYTQPAVFAVDYAVASTWIAWGVTPSALLGHSLGEYVAACLAGVMQLEHAIPLVAMRARLMQALPAGGAMFAVLADEATVRAAIRQHTGAEIAAVNGPRSVTIAGDEPALLAAISGAGLRAARLPVSHAFHSARMEPMLTAFRARLRDIPLRPPTIPVVSNLTGAPAGPAMTDPEYWVRQIREPVRFADGVRWLADHGHTLLEVGPGQVLSGLARDALADRDPPTTILSSLGRDPDDLAAMHTALAALWVRGAPIDFEAQRRDRRRIHMPGTVFERQRHAILPADTAPPLRNTPTPAPTRNTPNTPTPPRTTPPPPSPRLDDLLHALQTGELSVDDALAQLLRDPS